MKLGQDGVDLRIRKGDIVTAVTVDCGRCCLIDLITSEGLGFFASLLEDVVKIGSVGGNLEVGFTINLLGSTQSQYTSTVDTRALI